jgi:hypothetical protein
MGREVDARVVDLESNAHTRTEFDMLLGVSSVGQIGELPHDAGRSFPDLLVLVQVLAATELSANNGRNYQNDLRRREQRRPRQFVDWPEVKEGIRVEEGVRSHVGLAIS